MAIPRDLDKPTVNQIVKALGLPIPGYTIFAQYYIGNHRLAYASEKFRNTFGRLFALFCDNLCPTVIDVLADRLTVTGFQAKDDITSDVIDENLADWAWNNIWEFNRMSGKSGIIHREAMRAGDAYVIVWPNRDGVPVIHPQQANLCTLHVDQEDPTRKKWGAKGWVETETQRGRINLYLNDRIEKYVTINRVTSLTGGATLPIRDNAWMPFQIEGEPWPLPNPWGQIPMFHFANAAVVGEMGKSELKDMIPLQDALNKALLDLMVAMEFVALPQRWACGLDVEIDIQTGLPKFPFQPGVDRVWAVNDKDVKFGEFAQANLDGFLRTADMLRMEMARITGIPLHYINMSGNPPSGEALKSLETRLIKKVKDRQQCFGDVWEDVFNFCLEIYGKQGEITLLWEDPSPVSEKEHTEALLNKKALGVSEKQLLLELGYSDQQIEEMRQDISDEMQNLSDHLLTHFQGTLPNQAGIPAGGQGADGQQNDQGPADNAVGASNPPQTGFSGVFGP